MCASCSFPIVSIGCPRWWQLPYFWAGIKMYDLVAGIQCLKSSYVLSKTKALEFFPMLKKDKLVGAIVYYDGKCQTFSCCFFTLFSVNAQHFDLYLFHGNVFK